MYKVFLGSSLMCCGNCNDCHDNALMLVNGAASALQHASVTVVDAKGEVVTIYYTTRDKFNVFCVEQIGIS